MYIVFSVPKDPAEAARWYRKGAEMGYSVSQFNLGVLYEYGQGVPIDLAVARTWYEKAAKQDLPMATSALARLSASPADALKARIDAANKGLPEEMYNLGLAYLRGRDGASRSVQEARAWLQKSAEAGLEDGMCMLGLLLAGSIESLSKKEKDEVSDPKRGADWVLKAAQKGHPQACFAYSKLLLTGAGVEKDIGKAKQWTKMAAKRGCKEAETGSLHPRLAAIFVDHAPPFGPSGSWILNKEAWIKEALDHGLNLCRSRREAAALDRLSASVAAAGGGGAGPGGGPSASAWIG
eukprot:tig00020563_g11326.t1